MKKLTATLLSLLMVVSIFTAMSVNADETELGTPTGFTAENALFAHAVLNSADSEAWQAWQSAHDEDFNEAKPTEKYFFLPTSADTNSVDIYNGYQFDVSVNGVLIEPGKTSPIAYEQDKNYTVNINGTNYTLKFMKSNAEAAIYINNSDADGNGAELMSYLNSDKSLSAKATGAIVTPDGKLDNTNIKKIKGRGNTTWQKAKKAYNITYDSKVSIAGMPKSKKYSILANYQDDSLSRNRFLYDLSDAVGMPYASDSRYVDFYSDGYYWGSYQMCEKIDVGSSSLVSDFEETDYLDESGNVKEDFPFLCEVDASANAAEDYYVSLNNGLKVTIKAPELDSTDKGYNEVKEYVKTKFSEFYNASSDTNADISQYADVDSVAKIYLINELGKNWDSGASSMFFTYRQDENGKYKFYGSPVWDYDNSLGNATGVKNDLRNIGVTDYEEYSGWWCRYKEKGSRGKTSSNILNRLSQNNGVFEASKKIWFEKFVPAIDHFLGRKYISSVNSDFYTADKYYSLISDSALMNYKSGWLLKTSGWIADHSSLNNAFYDDDTKTYNEYKTTDRYADTFEGMYNYARDWMISRAAWMSKEMSDTSITTAKVDRPAFEPATEPPTTEPATTVPPTTDATTTEAATTREVTTEAETTKPQTTEPVTSGPVTTEPITSTPEPTEETSTVPETTAQETAEPITTNPPEPQTEPAENPTEVQQPTEPVTAPSIIPVDPVSEPVTEPQIQPVTDPIEKPSAVTKITLKKKSAKIYRRGTYKISVKIENKKGVVTFKSSKPKVAKVSSKGKIKALKKGTAYITIKNNSKSVKFKIKVKNPRLKVKKKTLKLGKKYKIKIIGKVGKAKFIASNKRIKVTKKGYVKALRKGKAKVKVKTNGIKLTFKVSVK